MIEQEFLRDLKWSIEETERKNTRKPSRYYKPSSMNCIRNMFYQRTEVTPESDDVSYCLTGICNSGTDIHIRTQTAVESMKNNGIDCEYLDVEKYLSYNINNDIEVLGKSGMETKLHSKNYDIVFMCDGIIKYKDRYFILEIKTETSNKFSTRFSVAEDHWNQARAYSMLLGLSDILFLYVCRDNLDMKTFIYSPTKEEKEELINKIGLCEGYVLNNQVPPKPSDTTHLKCNYCKYKNRCLLDS